MIKGKTRLDAMEEIFRKSEKDFKQLINKIDLNNLDKLNEIKELIKDNEKQIIKSKAQLYNVKKIIDILLENYTKLFDKTELIHLYVEGISESIILEQQDLRQGLYHIYRGLDIPFDEIKGWEDLSYEQDKTRKTRGSNRKKCKIMGRFKRRGKKKND